MYMPSFSPPFVKLGNRIVGELFDSFCSLVLSTSNNAVQDPVERPKTDNHLVPEGSMAVCRISAAEESPGGQAHSLEEPKPLERLQSVLATAWVHLANTIGESWTHPFLVEQDEPYGKFRHSTPSALI
jgi:hypothetical protein